MTHEMGILFYSFLHFIDKNIESGRNLSKIQVVNRTKTQSNSQSQLQNCCVKIRHVVRKKGLYKEVLKLKSFLTYFTKFPSDKA